MKKNPKNLSVQPQLSQQKEATPLSTLTMDELESVQGGGDVVVVGKFVFIGSGRCWYCNLDNVDG